ncbi:Ankyrin_repeat protein 1 [Hexamita inflata]|uniref:Ankyrin repeat protein 1 n=1 Tax=Hexamita inflata TaxID=28002 RepID=A0AA86QAA4_9EUKA|nr:Ankyrin repeat protein 1 [Hexamita inflata]
MEQWFQAAQQGDYQYIKDNIILARSVDQMFGNKTAMMYAAQENHYKIVNILLPFEAKMQNAQGSTALHLAVSKSSFDVIKILATFESDVRNNKGKTALEIATEKNQLDIIDLFEHSSMYEPRASASFILLPDVKNEQLSKLQKMNDELKLTLRKQEQINKEFKFTVQSLGNEQKNDLCIKEQNIKAEKMEYEMKLEYIDAEVQQLKQEVNELENVAEQVMQLVKQKITQKTK